MGRARTTLRDALASATAAVARGELGDGLVRAIEAWRACRDPALADAIDTLAPLVARTAALPAKGGKAQDDAFAERAALGDPLDFAALAATPLPRTLEGITARLHALLARPADPRLLTYLLALMAAPPHNKSQWWKLASAVVARLGDPRAIDLLVVLVERIDDIANRSVAPYAHRRVEDALDALREAYPALPAVDRAQLAGFVAAIGAHATAAGDDTRDGDQLLAEIYAHPDDDRARAVYGDWLQERGEPRGELIALQLAPPPPPPAGTRRATALIAEHAARWLGPLAPVIVLARSRFARGFLASAVVNARAAQMRATVGAAEWATVESLRFSGQIGAEEAVEIARHPVMRALRVAHGFQSTVLGALVDADPPLALVELGFTPWGDLEPSLRTCRGLPRLERITIQRAGWIVGVGEIADLASAPVADRLRELAMVSEHLTATLARGARGGLDVLRIALDQVDANALEFARMYVDLYATSLPWIAEVAVRTPTPLDDAQLARLLGPFARLPRT